MIEYTLKKQKNFCRIKTNGAKRFKIGGESKRASPFFHCRKKNERKNLIGEQIKIKEAKNEKNRQNFERSDEYGVVSAYVGGGVRTCGQRGR